jgi:hypothetical protein
MRDQGDCCRAIRRAINKNFQELYESFAGSNGPKPTRAQEALVIARHLQPGREDLAVFAHKHLRAKSIEELRTSGVCESQAAEVVEQLFNYLSHGGYAWDSGNG